MGARICPRCSTRVDERRAKGFCLSCGAELGPQSTAMPVVMGGSPSPTFSGKSPAKGSGSALAWILGGLGLFLLVGVGGVTLFMLASTEAEPPKPEPLAAASAAPQVETPVDAAGASAATNVKPPATVAVAPTRIPTVSNPTSLPTIPFPQPPPTVTVVRVDAAAPLGPFPRARAQAEVDRVAGGIGSCTRSTGPFGATTVRVDFEPDGRVGTTTQPPFAGTPVGSCISARFLAIRIGPFQGSTTSISRSFIIQQ